MKTLKIMYETKKRNINKREIQRIKRETEIVGKKDAAGAAVATPEAKVKEERKRKEKNMKIHLKNIPEIKDEINTCKGVSYWRIREEGRKSKRRTKKE